MKDILLKKDWRIKHIIIKPVIGGIILTLVILFMLRSFIIPSRDGGIPATLIEFGKMQKFLAR